MQLTRRKVVLPSLHASDLELQLVKTTARVVLDGGQARVHRPELLAQQGQIRNQARVSFFLRLDEASVLCLESQKG